MVFRPVARDFLFLSGFLLGAGSLVLTMTMPLRKSSGDEVEEFPSREMTLNGMTARDESTKSWSWWEKQTCDAYKIAATAVFRQDTAEIAETMAETAVPGIPQPCTTLHGCRDHIAVRCYWYEQMSEIKGRTIMYHVTGMGFYLFAIFGVIMQVNMKIAVLMGMTGGFIQLGACLYWALITDGMMNAIRTQAYWPYADLTPAFHGACACAGIMMSIAASGITLAPVSGTGKEPEHDELLDEEEEDEEEEDQ